MSWDKNTVSRSKLDEIARILDILEIPYTISVIGTVDGWGSNDQQFDKEGPSGHNMHQIRKLVSEKLVVLECMNRTEDCDSDDEIVSYTFRQKDVPQDWNIEMKILVPE